MSDHKEQGTGGGGHGGGSSRWLLTYADMITLMMVFFIVMYAMSEVDKNKYASLATGLRTAFGGGNMIVDTGMGVGDGVSAPMPIVTPPALNAPLVTTTDGLKEQIGEALLAEFQQDGRFVVYASERGLTISLVGSAAFDSGKAEIKPEFRPLLDEIAKKLAPIGNDISIEGFADTDPISTAEFPSNWELAWARANQVRRYLESKGVSGHRMIPLSYGDTRPIADNSTPEGKAKNRRVDVVILKDQVKVDLGQEINPAKP